MKHSTGMAWGGMAGALVLTLILTVRTQPPAAMPNTSADGKPSLQAAPVTRGIAAGMRAVHLHDPATEALTGLREQPDLPSDRRGLQSDMRQMPGSSAISMQDPMAGVYGGSPQGRQTDALQNGLADGLNRMPEGDGLSWGWLADDVNNAAASAAGDRALGAVEPLEPQQNSSRDNWTESRFGRSEGGNDSFRFPTRSNDGF